MVGSDSSPNRTSRTSWYALTRPRCLSRSTFVANGRAPFGLSQIALSFRSPATTTGPSSKRCAYASSAPVTWQSRFGPFASGLARWFNAHTAKRVKSTGPRTRSGSTHSRFRSGGHAGSNSNGANAHHAEALIRDATYPLVGPGRCRYHPLGHPRRLPASGQNDDVRSKSLEGV